MADNLFMNDVETYLKTLSEQTRKSYRWFLNRLVDWMEQKDIDPAALDADLLVLFLDDQTGRGDNSRRLAICAARSFYRWWKGSKSPVLECKLKRVNPEPQRCLSPKQAVQLLAAMNPLTDPGARDLAIVTLMMDTGLREAEICRADLQRLNLEERKLRVIVKGGVWGKAVFSKETADHLDRWLVVRNELRGKFHALAPTLFVKLDDGEALQPQTLRELFRRLSARVGFQVSAHDLRRTFATLSTKAGAPTRVAMAAGRWNNLDVFSKYTAGITAEDMEPWFPIKRLANGTL